MSCSAKAKLFQSLLLSYFFYFGSVFIPAVILCHCIRNDQQPHAFLFSYFFYLVLDFYFGVMIHEWAKCTVGVT